MGDAAPANVLEVADTLIDIVTKEDDTITDIVNELADTLTYTLMVWFLFFSEKVEGGTNPPIPWQRGA